MNNAGTILLVRLGKRVLGIETTYVREIGSDIPVFPLPMQLPDISHLALLRGVPQAILDTEYYLQIEHETRNNIVFLIGNSGLFIDEALQNIHVNQATATTDDETVTEPARFVKRLVRFRNKLIPIIDIPEILKDEPGDRLFSI